MEGLAVDNEQAHSYEWVFHCLFKQRQYLTLNFKKEVQIYENIEDRGTTLDCGVQKW